MIGEIASSLLPSRYFYDTNYLVAVLCHPHLKVEEYLSGTGIDIPLKAIVTKENGSWEIVKGGENISCAKIERAICALPCVRMAAAVGVKHELLGEIPCAVIVPNRSGVTEEEIRNELKKTLLKNEMPERIVFAEELPLLQSGKPDKRRIKRRFESGEESTAREKERKNIVFADNLPDGRLSVLFHSVGNKFFLLLDSVPFIRYNTNGKTCFKFRGGIMLKIAIVENDGEQSARLDGYVKMFAKESGEECMTILFTNGVDFVTDYTEDFDVVFMDIDMPLMDGMTAAEKLRIKDENVSIVFVTNLAQYALKGYKVNALDYLVKPVDYFEFAVELKKIVRMRRTRAGDFVWLTAQGILKRIPVMDIVYIDISDHEIRVHTKSETVSYRGTLKETEEKLVGKPFSRCHNCFIVNLYYVIGVDGDVVDLGKYGGVYISRNRRKKFMTDLTSYIATHGGYVHKEEN